MTTRRPWQGAGYLPQLDGLRAVAVLAVLLFHSGIPLFGGGFIGVDLFFVLSGFLITSLLMREFQATGSIELKNFYLRRLLRLGPGLLALLTVYCGASLLLLQGAQLRANLVDALIALFYLANWARAFALHAPDFLGHTWSLAIEEQFYLLWPPLLLVLLRCVRWQRIFAITVAGAVAAWLLRLWLLQHDVPLQRLYNGLDTRADMLMMGCALGVVQSCGWLQGARCVRASMLLRWLRLPAALGLLAFAHWATWYEPPIYYWGFVVVELLAGVVLLDLLLNDGGAAAVLLRTRWLVWTGSISYGLYLWHFPIYKMLATLGCGHLAVLLLGMPLTFAAAAASYYLLERRVLAFKDRFARPVALRAD